MAYIAIVLTKILGALYSIPFYALIGDEGGFIYSCAYSIYAIFLEISTSGIPIALSIIIGEYIALNKLKSKERAYKVGMRLVMGISVVAFLIMMIFATPIANIYMAKMTTGASVQDVATSIRVVSVCLLIVPFLSIERGYIQGHKFISVSSNSQLIEQLVRILVVLGGAYLVLKIFKQSLIWGISVALLGAFVGAGAALIYILDKKRFNKHQFPVECDELEVDSSSLILRKLAKYCVVIITISIAYSIYNIVDMVLIIQGLNNLGYSDEVTQAIAGISSTWVPKICNIITALTLGMVSSIAPHIADNYAKGDIKGIAGKLNQSVGMIILITLPLACGIGIFSDQVYSVFYGPREYGSYILRISIFLNVLVSIVTVMSMSLQSMKRGRIAAVSIVVGIVINTALDLPLIYLFDKIGFEAYLGAATASIIGQAVTLALIFYSIKHDMGISFAAAVKTCKLSAVPLIAMIAVVLLLSLVLKPIEERSFTQLLELCLYGGVGAVVYFGLAYKIGALQFVFGESFKDKLSGMLKRK